MNAGLDKLAMSNKNPIRLFRKIFNFVLKYKFDKEESLKMYQNDEMILKLN